MNKVKIIRDNSPYQTEDSVKRWMEKHPKVNVISINGAIRGNDGDTLTYILYNEGSNINIENLLKS